MFSEIEEKAIQEKLEQFKKVKSNILSFKDLEEMIVEKRMKWLKDHLPEMLEKYKKLPPEKAYRIIYLDYMKIDPKCLKVKIFPDKVRIDSYNFCPYLEACKRLGLELDTKFICKEVLEASVQKMVKIIHPRLNFKRNYQNIRPHCDFCEEYIEFI